MDDKNVVKKRVTLAIAFAVFIVVVIAVILLIKPVMSKVQENRTAKVSQETAQEAEEFLKTKYPEVVIEKREIKCVIVIYKTACRLIINKIKRYISYLFKILARLYNIVICKTILIRKYRESHKLLCISLNLPDVLRILTDIFKLAFYVP